MIESGKVEGDSSKVYFLLTAITGQSEEINQYLENVSISPIDISQKQLGTCCGTKFDPSKLDLSG